MPDAALLALSVTTRVMELQALAAAADEAAIERLERVAEVLRQS